MTTGNVWNYVFIGLGILLLGLIAASYFWQGGHDTMRIITSIAGPLALVLLALRNRLLGKTGRCGCLGRRQRSDA